MFCWSTLMDPHRNINTTRRIALITLMSAFVTGCAGNSRIAGAALGASALASVVGSAVGRQHRSEQQHTDMAGNVPTAGPARPAFG